MSEIKIPPWSYTALECFENCPRQYYHKYILKEKEPETEAMRHGTLVHKALEDRLESKKPLPDAYEGYNKYCNSIEKAAEGGELFTELPLAIDRDFKKTGFFSKDVWGRGKADVVVKKGPKIWCPDWKTGKVREKSFQVSVFAAFLFRMFEDVQEIFANNIWLQAGKVGESYKFSREENEKKIWQDIIRKINRIEIAAKKNEFSPKQSGLCGWCPVKSCEFNPERDR